MGCIIHIESAVDDNMNKHRAREREREERHSMNTRDWG
jgi:hypothetical protein